MTIRDLTQGGIKEGDKICHLTAVRAEREAYGKRGWTRWRWLCRCDCGQEIWIPVGNLQTGNSKSCGCMKPSRIATARTKHGHNRQRAFGWTSREYHSWSATLQRCFNEACAKYSYYGGRGITVSDRWRSDFAAFFADMGPRPPNTTIDRIDNDGSYEPGNCRWATPREQRLNQRQRRTYRGRPIERRAP